ncbi:hypothetical protein TWF481_002784 [Arthrobotrys musiformis]|uniref:Deacetylase sirtuin-type domain-containing protein n=1 Tax=Arthrobotrys musiformis TaxID=47236 RepID=A0AAV9VSF9_9PEZI
MDKEKALNVLATAKSFIVLYGAGVSASAGIATFRKDSEQPGTQLTAQPGARTKDRSNWYWKYALGENEVQTSAWLQWVAAQQTFLETIRPTRFHLWLNLEKYGRVREIFTMNVDDLEQKAGLIPEYNYYPVQYIPSLHLEPY